MLDSIREKSKKAIFWTSVETVVRQSWTFIITIILARLLLPEDFGLIAMVIIFITVSSALVDSGLSAALIYKKNVSDEDLSTVFYSNLILSVVIYIVLISASGLIADFFSEPFLKNLIPWLGLSFIFGAFKVVQVAINSRAYNFKIQAKFNLIGQVGAGIIAVILAYSGFGVWALVANMVTIPLISSGLYWSTSKWRPMLSFNVGSFKEMFGYGSFLVLASIVNKISDNLYKVIIGRYFMTATLGYYFQAHKIQRIPADKAVEIISRSTFPAMTSLANEDRNYELSEYYKEGLKKISFFVFPLLFLLSLLAEDFVYIVLSERWLPSAPYIQLLCFASIFLPLIKLSSNIILSKGQSKVYFIVECLKVAAIIIAIIITLQYGVEGIIVGQIFVVFLFFLIYLFLVSKLLKTTLFTFLRCVIPYLFLNGITYKGIFMVIDYYPMGYWGNVALYGPCYVLTILLLSILFKINQVEFKNIFK